MARKAVKAMADLRALEEQAERVNPIKGGKKTPSLKKATAALKKAEFKEVPSLHNVEMDEMAEMPSGEYVGGMKGFGAYLHAFEASKKKGGMKTGKYEGEGATPSMGLSQFRGGAAVGQVVGSGKKASKAAPVLESESESEDDVVKAVGGKRKSKKAAVSVSESSEVAEVKEVVGKKKRAPAGPSDGRRKRADLVKKVMADKGLSMIAASSYVKTHGLYKP